MVKVYSKRGRGRPRGVRKHKKGVSRSMYLTKTPKFNNYFFKRTFFKHTIQLSNTAPSYGAYIFKLSDLPNYTEFTNLFDRYRILGVKVLFIPHWSNVDANPVSTMPLVNPDFYTVTDYTEDGVPTSLNELYEDTSFRVTRGGKIHKRYLKPAVLSQEFESTIATAYSPKWKQWITTDDPATPHYCLKWGADQLAVGTTQNFYIRVMMTYYIQCKDVK